MIERKIIIGLITSTEYCERIKPIWNKQLIESAVAKRMADWSWEYFNKYGKAPGKEIETIFFTKVKNNKIPKELAEEIEEDILPGLSTEYEKEEFNLEYLVEETESYFKKQHLKIYAENIQSLLAAGEQEKAEQLADEYQPLTTGTGGLENFILTVDKIRRKGREHPTVLIKPWLLTGQMTIIYGQYGSGKSLLTISIAMILGSKDYDQKHCEIGKWQVKNPSGCLYIDGELGELEMEERIKTFEWTGKQPPGYKIRVLSVPEYQLETEDTFTLSDRKNQQKVIQWLKDNPTYKLVVLDSASTLFGLVDENNNSEWNTKINPLLRDLRALDVACILLHHAGKSEKKGLRGASAMGAMAHNIFRLTNSGKKDIDEGEAWFNITKDKQRASGISFKPFSLHYSRTTDKSQTHWDAEEIGQRPDED